MTSHGTPSTIALDRAEALALTSHDAVGRSAAAAPRSRRAARRWRSRSPVRRTLAAEERVAHATRRRGSTRSPRRSAPPRPAAPANPGARSGSSRGGMVAHRDHCGPQRPARPRVAGTDARRATAANQAVGLGWPSRSCWARLRSSCSILSRRSCGFDAVDSASRRVDQPRLVEVQQALVEGLHAVELAVGDDLLELVGLRRRRRSCRRRARSTTSTSIAGTRPSLVAPLDEPLRHDALAATSASDMRTCCCWYGGKKSMMRLIVSVAPIVCSVENTR